MRHLVVSMAAAVTFAGLAAGSAACSGGGGGSSSTTTPTPTNRSPSITSMSFSPSFGIQQLSTFSYSAGATDADGDSLTYAWDIAGNARTGASGSISFTNGGSGTARVTVSDGKGGSASDTRTFTVGSMTGRWVGTVDLNTCLPGVVKPVDATFTQSNTVVTGTVTLAEGLCSFQPGTAPTDPAEPGTINAAGTISIRVKIGQFTDVYFRGDMQTSGTRITGGLFGSGHTGTPFVLNKQ